MPLRMQGQRLDAELWDEITPLLQQHWLEIAHYQDIPLNPDREGYLKCEEAGVLRCFTARASAMWRGRLATVCSVVNQRATVDVENYGASPTSVSCPLSELEIDTLVGYAVFFVRPNMHYMDSVQAVQDVLYLSPALRGTGHGMRFIRYCDEELTRLGVQAVYHHVKEKHNFGPALERMGYELVDLIYAKRLDR
jgi:GNAT superfamily N-acetyltransferase